MGSYYDESGYYDEDVRSITKIDDTVVRVEFEIKDPFVCHDRETFESYVDVDLREMDDILESVGYVKE